MSCGPGSSMNPVAEAVARNPRRRASSAFSIVTRARPNPIEQTVGSRRHARRQALSRVQPNPAATLGKLAAEVGEQAFQLELALTEPRHDLYGHVGHVAVPILAKLRAARREEVDLKPEAAELLLH